MKKLICILFAAAVSCLAQTQPLPTYVGAGAAFNQLGTPRVNLWATAIYPVVSSIGMYSSTSTDIVPVAEFDPVTKRAYYAFSTSIRQGVHKTIMSGGKLTLLLGGDAGVGFSQAAPSGVNVSLAGSFTATAVYEVSKSFAVAVPIHGMLVRGNWFLIPEIGIMFKPGK